MTDYIGTITPYNKIIVNCEICEHMQTRIHVGQEGTIKERYCTAFDGVVVAMEAPCKYFIAKKMEIKRHENKEKLEGIAHLRIIFNGPCVILIRKDDYGRTLKKVVVRCRNEKYSWRKGALMAALKMFADKDTWNEFNTWYHDHPKREQQAAETMLYYLIGKETTEEYLKASEKAYGRANNITKYKYKKTIAQLIEDLTD